MQSMRTICLHGSVRGGRFYLIRNHGDATSKAETKSQPCLDYDFLQKIFLVFFVSIFFNYFFILHKSNYCGTLNLTKVLNDFVI